MDHPALIRFLLGMMASAGCSSISLAAPTPPSSLPYAIPEIRIPASQARQGVAADGSSIYAIDNSAIARYSVPDGKLLGSFEGTTDDFPHLNSCVVARSELVCASSNYPATPHRGTVEFFDATSLAHLRTIVLPQNPGSLTVLNRHQDRWWGIFANYDAKGGVPGKNHRDTAIVEFDRDFHIVEQWSLPASVLARLAPYSISGGSWDADGRLYVTGHDKPEAYVLALPERGNELRHLATIAMSFFGQAIDFDPRDATLLWGIDRRTKTVIASRIPRSANDAAPAM